MYKRDVKESPSDLNVNGKYLNNYHRACMYCGTFSNFRRWSHFCCLVSASLSKVPLGFVSDISYIIWIHSSWARWHRSLAKSWQKRSFWADTLPCARTRYSTWGRSACHISGSSAPQSGRKPFFENWYVPLSHVTFIKQVNSIAFETEEREIFVVR